MVLAANNTVYPRQHNKRFTTISTHLSADTCLYAWGYTSPMANERWTSSQKYVNISDNDEVTVVGSVIPYNTNGGNVLHCFSGKRIYHQGIQRYQAGSGSSHRRTPHHNDQGDQDEMVVMGSSCIINDFSLFFKCLTYLYTDMRHCDCCFHQLV